MRRHFDEVHVFVDSGAFGAFFIDADINNRNALAIVRLLSSERRRLVTTNFIIAETHALVLRRAGRDAALKALDRIDGFVNLVERVRLEDEIDARAILEKYDDKTFSYTDATSFAVMERLGLRDVFTFDRHFAQFGFSPLKPN